MEQLIEALDQAVTITIQPWLQQVLQQAGIPLAHLQTIFNFCQLLLQ